MAVEVVDQVAVVHLEPNGDESLGRSPEKRRVHRRVEAGQDTPLPQPANALEAARGREADQRRELLVGDPCILLQFEHELPIDSVQRHVRAHVIERCSVCLPSRRIDPTLRRGLLHLR